MRLPLLCVLLALCGALSGGLAQAADGPGETARETYELPGRGSLLLDVPVDWQAVYVSPTPGVQPGLRFTPLEGAAFQLSVTIFWYDGLDRDITRPETLRELLGQVGEQSLALVSGQALDLEAFDGAQGQGYLFRLSDPDPAEGDYPHLTQGVLALEGVVLAFTLLHQTPDSAEAAAALAMLRGARLRARPRGV